MKIEHLIPLSRVAELLRVRHAGKHVHRTTLYRWTTKGVSGVRLAYTQVGATRCTTLTALSEFFESLQKPSTTASPVSRSSAELAGQILDAEERRMHAGPSARHSTPKSAACMPDRAPGTRRADHDAAEVT